MNRGCLFLIFIICVIQGLTAAYIHKKTNTCEKQARQLTNRIKNALKDYKYLMNSFDCNLRYIFDGAYSEFSSNVYDLNEMVQKSTLDKCKNDYQAEIDELGEQPFDNCYNSSVARRGYEMIDIFEKSVNAVCKDCGLIENNCNIKMKELSDNVEDFRKTIPSMIKEVEKSVEECVTNKAKVVSSKLKDLNESLAKCI